MPTDKELLQQALDALITAQLEGNCEYGVTDALRARLAQSEPYAAQAAMVASQTQGRMSIDPVTGNVSIGTVKRQREWQGLTDEERLASWNGIECDLECLRPAQYARAIETKLKEKNGV